MKPNWKTTYKQTTAWSALAFAVLGAQGVHAQTAEELQQRIAALEAELAQTRAALQATEEDTTPPEGYVDASTVADAGPPKIQLGELTPALDGFTIGGMIRANYTAGDYGDATGAPSRSFDDSGAIALDVFGITLGYAKGPWSGTLQYRFYGGYQMVHTGEIGYSIDDTASVKVGVTRVPFGPGAWGISQSWFFDQHYYVGLADDMDLGVVYTKNLGDLTIDVAYFYGAEPAGSGGSEDGARYSYDLIYDNAVNGTNNGYKERNQFNVRAIYSTSFGDVDAEIGGSIQFGQLAGQGSLDDGSHYAVSFHPKFKVSGFTIAPQLTYYSYDVDAYVPDSTGMANENLVSFGAFDYWTPVAAEAFIPAISISYYQELPGISWIDYVIPFFEYSSIIKSEDAFNNSDLMTVGAAWGRGGWYIYTEAALSNGNDFVGNESGFSRFGENLDDQWETRINLNFGYYF